MPPLPASAAFTADRGFGARKITTQLQNLIEGNRDGVYHRLVTLAGPLGPVHDQGGGSTKPTAHFIPQPPRTNPIPRQAIPKTPSTGPVYSEKSPPFQTIEIETLQGHGPCAIF